MGVLSRLFGKKSAQPNSAQLRQYVSDFVSAKSHTQYKHILEEHPELLSDEADGILAQLVAAAREHGKPVAERGLGECRRLLRRCRAEGVDAAFAHLTQSVMMTALQELLSTAKTFIEASTWSQAKHIAEQNPELLSDDGDAVMEIITSEMSDERGMFIVTAYREFLRLCRTGKMDAIFANLPQDIEPSAYLALPFSLQTLGEARTLAESKRIIERYPELLSDVADNVLERLITEQTDEQTTRHFTECRVLLRRCRAEGVDGAFASLPKPVSTDALLMLPYTLQTLIKAQTWEEVKSNVELHPELLSEEADALLAQFISTQTDEQAGHILSEYSELLRRCRAEGADATFTDLLHSSQNIGPRGPTVDIPIEFTVNLSRELIKQWTSKLKQQAPEGFEERMERFVNVMPPQCKALGELVATNSWTTQRDLIEQHPELLSDWAINTLERHMASIRRGGYGDTERRLGERKYTESIDLLRQCREVGVTQVFSEKKSSAHEEPEVAEIIGAMLQLPESLCEIIGDLLPSEAEIDELEIESLQDMVHFLDNRLAARPDLQEKLEQAFLTSSPPVPISDTIKLLLYAIFTPFLEELSKPIHLGEASRYAKLYQWALALVDRTDNPEFWAELQDRLGNCLVGMPSKGWGGNIEQAIEAFNQALEVRTREAIPAEWAESMIGLAMAYYERIEGDKAENIEQAMKFLHEALQVLTRQRMPLLWARAIIELAVIYAGRIRGDRAENIERAIELYQQAIEVKEVAFRALIFMNLATAYQKRIRGDRAENIERAIELYRQALEVCTRETTPVEWAKVKLELGHAYMSCTEGDKAKNVESAINAYEEALEVRTREAWPAEWANTMMGLASAYMIRALGDRMENIERTIEMYEQALKVWIGKMRHYEAARARGMLATAYLMRIGGSRPENFDRAVDMYQQTLDDLTPEAHPVFCRATAYMLGNLHLDEGQWEEAHIAYGKAITAGEMLYQAAATEITRQIELSQALYLFSNDAYCLARLDRFTEAVERLEAGKARALAEALARDRAALEQATPADRKAFETARNRIKGLEVEFRAMEAAGPENATARSFTEISEDLRSARQELAEVVKCIRTYVPDFMPKGLDFEAIAAAAAPVCPLVYLITTSQGSLALIVPAGAKSLEKKYAVWLDDFQSDDLNELLSQKDADGNVIGGYLLGQVGGNMRLMQVALEQALPILGKQLMSPVTARLVGLGFQQATLIPSGRLGLLPLHAGRYPADGGSRTFLDDFEVTYAPSARALAASHRAVEAAGARAPSFFAVADPPHTGAQRLAFARVEVEDIVPLFTASANCPLYAEQATRAEALKASPGRTHIHFSCHGSFDPMEPLNSALLLAHEDRLTLQDILDEADLKGARLATLSACQTAITDYRNVPDEAVGLPAGFLQAGVAGVVGSLWSVNDVSTALLIVRFYQYHLGKDESGESIEPLPPATALRSAQLWLRDATREELGNSCLALVRMSPGEAHRELVLAGNPSEKPYANPYFWAAFTFTGA